MISPKEAKKDAAAVLRCYRRSDWDGIRILVEAYRPDPSRLLAATLLLCRDILADVAETLGEDADTLLSRWVAGADPEGPDDAHSRRMAADLVSTVSPSTGGTPPDAIHFALLELASALNDQAAAQSGEDSDEILDAYLTRLALDDDDA